MIALGILLGAVGSDVNTGAERLTFGLIELSEGARRAARHGPVRDPGDHPQPRAYRGADGIDREDPRAVAVA